MMMIILLSVSGCIKDEKDQNFGDWIHIDDFSYVSDVLVIDSTLYVTGLHGVAVSRDAGLSFSLLNNGLEGAMKFPNRITSIAGMQVNGMHYLYAGTYYGGIYVTTDGGNSWFGSNAGLTTQNIYNIGAGHGLVFTVGLATLGSGGGTFRSTDYGFSWAKIGGVESPLEPGVKYAVEYFHIDTTLVFGGAGSGVYISSDQGLSWTETARIQMGQAFLSWNQSLYVGTDGNGIFRTTDHGFSWTHLTPEFERPRQVVALAASNGIIFGCTGVLYASEDNGQTWSVINAKMHEHDAVSFLTNAVVVRNVVFVVVSGGTAKEGLWMNRKYLLAPE